MVTGNVNDCASLPGTSNIILDVSHAINSFLEEKVSNSLALGP